MPSTKNKEQIVGRSIEWSIKTSFDLLFLLSQANLRASDPIFNVRMSLDSYFKY